MADLDKSDLKTIEGIGPGMEAKLKDLGIHTVADLAARTDPDDIAGLLESRQVTADRVRQWIEAAKTPASDVAPAEVVAAARVVTPHTEVVVTAPIDPVAKPPKVTEPTLHQLNMQSRAIDRQHAELRNKATEAANKAAETELRGIARLRTPRRLQKNLRPLVR
jgi:hypothetical protein